MAAVVAVVGLGAVEVDDDDLHADQVGRSDQGGEGDVGGVAAVRDTDEPVDRCPTGGIEEIPLTVEEGLEEAVKVGRVEVNGVPGDVTGGNPERPTETDREVGVVATHAGSRHEHVDGGGRRIGAARHIAQQFPDPVADAGDSLEAGLEVTERLAGETGQQVGLAVPARMEISEDITGQVGERNLGPRDVVGDVGGSVTVAS